MFKRAQNTPLSSWAITDLTIIVAWCYLPGLYSVFADQQQQQSDPAIPLWWLCKCKCKMGLKKRFTRSVFYWVVCLHNNSDKGMSRLSSSLPWLPDPMIDWLIIIEGSCSCSCSPWSSCINRRLSTNTRTRARPPWKENEDEFSRTAQIRPGHVVFGFRLDAAVVTCFICLFLVL